MTRCWRTILPGQIERPVHGVGLPVDGSTWRWPGAGRCHGRYGADPTAFKSGRLWLLDRAYAAELQWWQGEVERHHQARRPISAAAAGGGAWRSSVTLTSMEQKRPWLVQLLAQHASSWLSRWPTRWPDRSGVMVTGNDIESLWWLRPSQQLGRVWEGQSRCNAPSVETENGKTHSRQSALRARAIDRDRLCGRHYGQRPLCTRTKQAAHMAAPTEGQASKYRATESRPHMAQSGHSSDRGGMTAPDPKRTFAVAKKLSNFAPRSVSPPCLVDHCQVIQIEALIQISKNDKPIEIVPSPSRLHRLSEFRPSGA